MENRRDRRADVISGIFWILLGVLIIGVSSSMDIRAHLGATFLTGPGFVPILLAVALCILGLILILRSHHGHVASFLADPATVSSRRALGAAVLLLIYSVGMVGRIPFGIATFIFITAFIVVFNLPVGGVIAFAKLLAKAGITAAITAVVVVYTFEEIFLVRLP